MLSVSVIMNGVGDSLSLIQKGEGRGCAHNRIMNHVRKLKDLGYSEER